MIFRCNYDANGNVVNHRHDQSRHDKRLVTQQHKYDKRDQAR